MFETSLNSQSLRGAVRGFASLGLAAACLSGAAVAQDADAETYDLLGLELPRWNASGWAGQVSEPVTQPYLFESPFVHTSLRGVFIRHNFPGALQPVLGESLDVYALQARIGLTDRLAIIATKDGIFDGDPEAGADSRDGLADIAGGVKYAFINDPENGRILTGGVTFEFTQGTREVFQGNGDGIVRPFVSGGMDLGEFDLVGALGLSAPLDGDAESTYFDWHLHAAYEVTEDFKPFVETNCITYISGGDSSSFGLVGIEAVDVGNLGSEDVAGNDVITGAVGAHYSIGDHVTIGGAYEFPYLTSRDDLYQERWTFDVTVYL